MNDYERMTRVIRYLEANRRAQPDLESIAAYAELSPAHLHRTFTAWAGVTPKDFLQCLTLADARASLRRGSSVLAAALEAGLSGPDACTIFASAWSGEPRRDQSGRQGLGNQCGLGQQPPLATPSSRKAPWCVPPLVCRVARRGGLERRHRCLAAGPVAP